MADWVQPYAPVFDPQGDTTSQMLDKLNKNQVDVYTKLNRVRKLDASNTAPSDQVDNHLWLSLNDYTVKRWNGKTWARTNVIGVSNETELINVINGIGTQEGVILISEPIKLTADLTIPENIQLKFLKGAYIDSDTTVGTFTLTVDGGIDAGLYRIFGDNLTVNGSPVVEAVYPEWFGAVGDGVNDDATAIQKAIDFYDTVILQDKTYIVSSSIKLHSGSRLIGKGKYKTLLYNNTTNTVPGVEVAGTSTARLSDIAVIGIGVRNGTASSTLLTVGKDGIKVEYADNVLIRDCYIYEIEGNFGLRTKYSTNIKVLDSHFYRCSYSCFTVLVECENIWVERNIFDTTTAQDTPQNYLFATGGENLNEGQIFCKNVWVRNNVFKNNPRWEGIDTHGCENIWIENNYVENVRIGIMCGIADGYVAEPKLKNVFIKDNILIAKAQPDHSGIAVLGSDAYDLAENVYIENNEVIGFGSTLVNTIGSITVYLCRNVKIKSNKIKSGYGIGISLYHTVLDCEVSGNQISDFAGGDSLGYITGIRLRSYGLFNVDIEKNRIYQGKGLPITYGIRADTAYIYTKINSNYIQAVNRYSNAGYMPVYKTASPTIPAHQGDFATDTNDKPTYWCTDLNLKCGGVMDWSTITVSGIAGNNYVDITAGDKRMIPIGAEIIITGGGSAGDLITEVVDIDYKIGRIYLKDALAADVADTTISSGTPTWI